ncbi:uncharacterized protein LOC130808392 [Amaranthus tricolor]|uniref:uncharacterized protein LOC130808392 n=1 Tax=Amaranthus tricolor TaxID=29722 RepID=UPI002587BAD0|nr:uncharacterized protein LOC130808392 [Amaranthus tricolor]
MEKLGFGRKWIRWIMNCVSTASMSILLNGSPLKPFKMEKGLSPGTQPEKADDLNLIEAVDIGKTKVCLKHLLFADDTLIFTPRNSMCITNYFRILDVFAMMSGLSLNYSKSCFISWNSSDHSWVRDIARSVRCLHSICPFTYLGFSLGDHMNRCAAWKPMIEKIQNKLASWKAKILSRAGRLTMIKSVINSLPVYYMSMFKMPKSIASKIVKLQRRFFWGGSNGEKMGCLRIKWSVIQLPK